MEMTRAVFFPQPNTLEPAEIIRRSKSFWTYDTILHA